ncbi:hypothetical protein ABW19_dt0209956 [Dactylella cylindrospora]|nr:hypothetical protein ABW19_dt0209956 [Dactylella cylindrospora]
MDVPAAEKELPGLTPPPPRVISVAPRREKNKNRNRDKRLPEIRELAAKHIKDTIGLVLRPDKVAFPRWTKFHKTIPYHWRISGTEERQERLNKILYEISPGNWNIADFDAVKTALLDGSLKVVRRGPDGELEEPGSPETRPLGAETEHFSSFMQDTSLDGESAVDASIDLGGGNMITAEHIESLLAQESPELAVYSGHRRKRARIAQQDGSAGSAGRVVEVIQDTPQVVIDVAQLLNPLTPELPPRELPSLSSVPAAFLGKFRPRQNKVKNMSLTGVYDKQI